MSSEEIQTEQSLRHLSVKYHNKSQVCNNKAKKKGKQGEEEMLTMDVHGARPSIVMVKDKSREL
jgi:hypothetical protein